MQPLALAPAGLAGLTLADAMMHNDAANVDPVDAPIPTGRLVAAAAVATVAVPALTVLSAAARVAEPVVTAVGCVKPLRLLFAHEAGAVRPDHMAQREQFTAEILEHGALSAVNVTLSHRKGEVHGCYMRSRNASYPSRRVAILCGGSTEALEDQWEATVFLLERGIDVFGTQPSNYPSPWNDFGQGASETPLEASMRRFRHTIDEESVMLDGLAIVGWLTSGEASAEAPVTPYTIDQIMVEGHSLGTCTAHMLARSFPDLAAVVVVEPLASIGDVASYAAINHVCDALDGWLPRSTLHRVLYPSLSRCAHVVGRLAFRPSRRSGVPGDARGFDAHGAVANFRGAYLAVEAGKDILMSLAVDRRASRPGAQNFATRLVSIAKRRRGVPASRSRIIRVPTAQHGSSRYYQVVRDRYDGFLRDIGFAS